MNGEILVYLLIFHYGVQVQSCLFLKYFQIGLLLSSQLIPLSCLFIHIPKGVIIVLAKGVLTGYLGVLQWILEIVSLTDRDVGSLELESIGVGVQTGYDGGGIPEILHLLLLRRHEGIDSRLLNQLIDYQPLLVVMDLRIMLFLAEYEFGLVFRGQCQMEAYSSHQEGEQQEEQQLQLELGLDLVLLSEYLLYPRNESEPETPVLLVLPHIDDFNFHLGEHLEREVVGLAGVPASVGVVPPESLLDGPLVSAAGGLQGVVDRGPVHHIS